MQLSDLPPGVSASNPHIDPGCNPWERVHEQIDQDCEANSFADLDCWAAWKLGVAVYKVAKGIGAKFPHD